MMDIEKVKYCIIEILCKQKSKKELLKALKDALCFADVQLKDN